MPNARRRGRTRRRRGTGGRGSCQGEVPPLGALSEVRVRRQIARCGQLQWVARADSVVARRHERHDGDGHARQRRVLLVEVVLLTVVLLGSVVAILSLLYTDAVNAARCYLD